MRTALLALLALATPVLASQQTVWKWVDDKGVTHYSDRPIPGATRMEVHAGPSNPGFGPNTLPSVSPPEEAGAVYRNFEIWKPAPDETLVNTGGQVTVNIRIDPALQVGHQLYLYFDGRLVEGFPPNITSYEFKDVPRGTHMVSARINNSRGKRVQQTENVTFYVRQESVAQPPVGPSLRPPPKQPPRPRGRGASNKLPTSQPSYSTLQGQRATIDPATNLPVKTLPAPAGPKKGP